MADESVNISLTATGEAAVVAALKSINESLRGISDAQRQTAQSTNALDSSFASLKNGFTAATVTAGVWIAAAEKVFGAASNIAEGLDKSNKALAAYRGNIDKVVEGTGGLISRLDLLATSNDLAVKGFQLSDKTLQQLAVQADIVADKTGGDVTEAFKGVANALVLANQGGERGAKALREYGLEGANAAEAIADLDKKVGDARVEIDNLGDGLESFGNKAKIAFENFVTDLGALSPEISDFGEAASQALSDIGDDAIEFANFAARQIVSIFEAVGKAIDAVAEHAERIFNQIMSGNFSAAAGTAGALTDALQNQFDEFMRQSAVNSGLASAGVRAGGSGQRTGPGDQLRPPGQPGRGGGGGGGGSYEDIISAADRFGEELPTSGEDVVALLEDAEERKRIAEQRTHDQRMENQSALTDAISNAQHVLDEAAKKEEAIRQNEITGLQAVASAMDMLGVHGKAANAIKLGLKGAEEIILGNSAQAEALAAAGSFNAGSAALFEAAAVKHYINAALAFSGGVVGLAGGGGGGGGSGGGGSSARTSPRATGGTSSGGDSEKNKTVVINFNGPTVTAQTYADLGRELKRSLEESTNRYG